MGALLAPLCPGGARFGAILPSAYFSDEAHVKMSTSPQPGNRGQDPTEAATRNAAPPFTFSPPSHKTMTTGWASIKNQRGLYFYGRIIRTAGKNV